jgi:hypothetical protein
MTPPAVVGTHRGAAEWLEEIPAWPTDTGGRESPSTIVRSGRWDSSRLMRGDPSDAASEHRHIRGRCSRVLLVPKIRISDAAAYLSVSTVDANALAKLAPSLRNHLGALSA